MFCFAFALFSEAGLESKMSLKILNSKMSFRLRRSSDKSAKEKKSSGDEMSDTMESSDSKVEKLCSSSSDIPFELDQVRFEKVGESYIKHEKIREETIEDSTPSPVKIADINDAIKQLDNQTRKQNSNNSNLNSSINNNNYYFNNNNSKSKNNNNVADETDESKKHDNQFRKTEINDSVDSIKEDGITITENGNLAQECDEKVGMLKSTLEHLVLKPEPVYANLLDMGKDEMSKGDQKTELQCPTFEIMPPSRRSSFDPPRSPYLALENLRSDTDPEIMNLNRLDSAGDSFEMIETDRNRESSFESRYPSSSHTSFDISRYQSTSCEDPTSSFEIIDLDNQKSGGSGSGNDEVKVSTIEVLRKSSIELVDVETFQKSGIVGRKSSLETHFDFAPGTPSSRFSTPKNKKHIGDHYVGMKGHHSATQQRSPLLNQSSSNYSSRESHDSYSSTKWHQQNQAHLLNQCSSSIRRSSFADPSKQHSPIYAHPMANEMSFSAFASNDHRLEPVITKFTLNYQMNRNSIIFPLFLFFSIKQGLSIRPHSNISSMYLSSHLTSSSEFEPPSPRRAASASPKHTFTFRIVLKKVDSSPDALCPSSERRRSKDRTDRIRRRDSRKKRFWEAGKSF